MSIHADAGLKSSVFPTLSLVCVALAVAAYGCVSDSSSAGKAGDTASAGIDSATPAQTCTGAISVAFEDGTRASFDCVAADLSATFEFDPDTPPEVRTLALTLHGVEDAGFECTLDLSIEGICDDPYYVPGLGLTATLSTQDCTGVPDEFEGTFEMVRGRAYLAETSAGSEPGNFTNEPVPVVVSGDVNLEGGGLTVTGSFEVLDTVTGADAEEASCSGAASDPGFGTSLTGYEGTDRYTFEDGWYLAQGISSYDDYAIAEDPDCSEPWGFPAISCEPLRSCELEVLTSNFSEAPDGCVDCLYASTVQLDVQSNTCSWLLTNFLGWNSGSKTFAVGVDPRASTYWTYNETSRRWERSTGYTQEWSSGQVVLGYDGPIFQDTDWSRLERTRTVSWW